MNLSIPGSSHRDRKRREEHYDSHNELRSPLHSSSHFTYNDLYVRGVVGHQTSFPSDPVCYLSLETVFNMFHSVLLAAEIAGARLAQVDGIC